MPAERQFYEYADGLAASSPAIDHHWSKDQLTISFPKKNQRGFDITIIYNPSSRIIEFQTDRGYHDHFHTDKFENFPAALDCVFGLVRDLLSRNMRIEETQANGVPRRWRLQANINGRWTTQSSVGLLFWNVFGKKSTIEYSNDVLPPRELVDDA